MNARLSRLAALMLVFQFALQTEVLSQNREKKSDAKPARSKVTLKVLDAGAEPRSVLRYRFQEGASETMVMDMTMTMAMELGGRKIPAQKIPMTRTTMTIASDKVTEKGDLEQSFELIGVDVVSKPGDNPAIVAAMNQQMGKMVGLQGTCTLTSRGFASNATIKTPPETDLKVQQLLDGMSQSIEQMSAPLPEEAVGKGAKWQTTMPIEMNGMKLTQIVRYTVKEIKGDKLVVDILIDQDAEEQQFSPPGVPATVTLKSLETTGTATAEVTLSTLVPKTTTKIETTNVIETNGQRVKTRVNTSMKVYPQPASK